MEMLGTVNPQMAKKAKSEYSKYSPDLDGLKQAVTEWGGMVMIDKACEFVKSHPKVAGALRMANIDPEQIRRELNGAQPAQQSKGAHKNTSSNSYRDRLNKLR